jgi:hypothetical protein
MNVQNWTILHPSGCLRTKAIVPIAHKLIGVAFALIGNHPEYNRIFQMENSSFSSLRTPIYQDT